jgi:gustatory receptor
MCFDVLEVEEGRYFVYCSLYRIAYFISIVLIIQFCHLVSCTQQRLFILRKEVSSVLENKTSFIVTSILKPIFVEAVRKSKLSSTASVFAETENIMRDSRTNCQTASNNFLFPPKVHDLHKIITCRQIYCNIYDAVQLINSIYGFLLVLLFIRAAAGLVTNIYYLASTTINGDILLGIDKWGSPAHIFSLACWISIFLSTIIAVTVTCQMVILESKQIGDIIQKLLLLQHARCDIVQQLELFSEQLAKNQIEFSAFCLFKVDMSLLGTILASVTSYIIVLVQFK